MNHHYWTTVSRKRDKGLTPRMAEILAHHASGLNMRQVSAQMFLSYSSVANTVQEIRKRLKASTLAACVIRAHAMGYLSHPDSRGIVKPLDPNEEERP